MNMKKYPVSRKANLVIQEMEGELLIYDLTENKAFCLNETSALVWQACDGKSTASEISEIISQKLNTPANEDLVWFAIDQLKRERLIENSDDVPNHFAGMSRREVIKRVGLGSMVALPIVASLVAPSAAFAQSCGSGTVADGMGCAVNIECVSCCCGVGNLCTVGGQANGNSPCINDCECAVGVCMANNMMCTA